ncbi:MAG: MMPL family transporter [Candidatus Nanopelagicaceae bacterium]|nr:MMPL family transporter [Candidatus Nanopelagicaceae bacterium]
MNRLAQFSFKHRRLVIVAWVLLLLAMVGLGKSVGSIYSSSFALPNTESSRATEVIQKSFPRVSGDTLQIVFQSDSGLKSDSNQQLINSLVGSLKKLPHVDSVQDPYSQQYRALSPDRTIGFATVRFDGLAKELPSKTIQDVVDTAQSISTESLQVEFAGEALKQIEKPMGPSESTGLALLAAFVVLLLTFGSVVATIIPMVVAVVGLGISSSLIALLSHQLSIASFAPTLAALVGLGVGIDYALFIVTRFRRSIHEGKSPEESIRIALLTSGRAVLFAGSIVCISMLGLFTVGVSMLYGVAIATSMAVLVTMLAALTLLPALLSVVGTNIDRLKIPGKKLHEESEGSNTWRRWSQMIERHPVRWITAAALVVLFLGLPALSMRTGSSDAGNDAKSSTTFKAYDLLAKGFGPGYNGPLTLVATLPKGGEEGALENLRSIVAKDADVAMVFPAMVTPDGQNAVISIYAKSAPQDEATSDLVKRLREQTIPSAMSGTGIIVYVGGLVAINQDFADVLKGKLPYFIGSVVLLSFLLLMLLFRSLLIPATAAFMNLLSMGAAFGVIVAAFQWGWAEPILGAKGGPIEPFLPIMLFAIVFGLSMDYEVFLVTRIQEEWLQSKDNSLAVNRGLAATGGVITAAASIMVVVFTAFVFGGERTIQEFGSGLAIAVLVDATIVRSMLVPALMHVGNRVNWWLPHWLSRLLLKTGIKPL